MRNDNDKIRGKTLNLVLYGILVLALIAGAALAWRHHNNQQLEQDRANFISRLNYPSVAPAGQVGASLAQLKGKALVVNFWATWCAPCIKEMPELDQLRTELKGTATVGAIEFVGIGIDNADKIAQFLQKTPIQYPLFAAGAAGAELGRHYGNANGFLPFTVLLDTSGKVIWSKLGVVQMAELKQQILTQIRQTPGK
jgi:thiol-disulfide isomerase/thioredoxin